MLFSSLALQSNKTSILNKTRSSKTGFGQVSIALVSCFGRNNVQTKKICLFLMEKKCTVYRLCFTFYWCGNCFSIGKPLHIWCHKKFLDRETVSILVQKSELFYSQRVLRYVFIIINKANACQKVPKCKQVTSHGIHLQIYAFVENKAR